MNLQPDGDILVLLATRTGQRNTGIVTITGLAGPLKIEKTGGMRPPPDPHYCHRFPAEIISHAVWLYHVFNLSLRNV
jgi:hypothetical protein